MPRNVNTVQLKYADDVAVCNSRNQQSDYVLQDSIDEIVRWSEMHNLTINPEKTVELIFSLKTRNAYEQVTDNLRPITIKGEPVARHTTNKYLGVFLSYDLKWSVQTSAVFTKIRKMCFFVRKLKVFSVPHKILVTFINACILPLITYCSPVIFPGLLKKDFRLIYRMIKGISRCSGISETVLRDTIIQQHMKSSLKFAENILRDTSHPLHVPLNMCVSTSATRASFVILPARSRAYQCSVLPYLSRILVNSKRVEKDLRENLSLSR